ncbi:MAG: metallophosphoesterase [Gemmatimonadetes bacterium]|nr:metallophosphoesterase [Gemmatimonadota bacterium]
MAGLDVTVLHASDLHFGPAYDPSAGEALLRLAQRVHPDVIVLSGDFTQRAKRRQYEAARAYLASLPPVPRVVTPGNHDVPLYRFWERIWAPYRNYRQYISGDLDSVTRIPGVTIVALNSTAPYTAIVNGRISEGQIAYAAKAFSAAPPGDARVVVAHHHLVPAPDHEGGAVIPGARRILDSFHEMGVELILGGHLHRSYIGNSLDLCPVDAASPRKRTFAWGKGPGSQGEGQWKRGIVIVQSGTATSRRGRGRERAGNSVNLVHIEQDRVDVAHYGYFAGCSDFAPISRHTFPRGLRRFLPEEEPAGATRPTRRREDLS